MSEPEFHRDRRQHGGAAQRLDDDKLAELTEDERVEAGLDDFNPDEVPAATDPLPDGVQQRTDVPQSAKRRRVSSAASTPTTRSRPPTTTTADAPARSLSRSAGRGRKLPGRRR